MPPAGPKPGVDKIWGDEIECFKPLRCNIVGTPGEARGARDRVCLLAAPVFRLSKLGFLLPFSAGGAGGLMNEGDEGSEVCRASTLELRLRARLFGFFGFRGEGDVMGRSLSKGNRMGVVSTILRL